MASRNGCHRGAARDAAGQIGHVSRIVLGDLLDHDGVAHHYPHFQAVIPIRLISHSSSTPEFSRTLRRTSSPRISMSAAVAFPRLIRKLQCISDTCASPMTRPLQPATSMSFHALLPGGFLKVEPPVFSLMG